MTKRPFNFTRLRTAGISVVLTLGLLACTEKKTPDIPQPTPTPTPTASTNAEAKDYADYTELMWSDEFNGGGAVDPTKWTAETGGDGWGNKELEYYTTSTNNALVSGGNLIIQAQKESQGGRDYTSARLITKGKQSFTFGRLDVLAKLPHGVGIWPAIWMLGSDIDQNNWPVCGEIDIMELRGQEPNKMLSTMHFGTSFTDHRYKGTDITLSNGNFSDDFHLFSMVRSKDKMRFYLDGKEYYTFTSSDASPYPFNNPFFVVLNLAIGGDFVSNPSAAAINANTFPQRMLVDYVRFYQYK